MLQQIDIARKNGGRNQYGKRTTLSAFTESDAGIAFAEAVPALYAALEPLEDDTQLAALQAPFGAVLTALQLMTGTNSGFAHAEAILGASRAKALRDACRGVVVFAGVTSQYNAPGYSMCSASSRR